MKGKFISLEGPDGSGKTTVLHEIAEQLSGRGYSVVCTREPGGTKLSEDIRRVLLNPESKIGPHAEALLYASARAQHIEEIILPALESGKIVLSDRFVDSSFAYQGIARGLGMEFIQAINRHIVNEIGPFLTIILCVKPEIVAARVKTSPDRIESEGMEFQEKVIDGYWMLRRHYPKRIQLVNASLPLEQVCEQAMSIALAHLNGSIPGWSLF